MTDPCKNNAFARLERGDSGVFSANQSNFHSVTSWRTFLLESTIINESVPQLSWGKIQSILGVMVLVNYDVTSCQL